MYWGYSGDDGKENGSYYLGFRCENGSSLWSLSESLQ